MAAQPEPKLLFFGLILLAVGLEVVADVLFKKWAIENRNLLLFAGLALYFAGTIFWAFSLKYESLSKAISVFTVLNLVAIILIGALYFKEDISALQKAGIMLGVISVFIMEFG